MQLKAYAASLPMARADLLRRLFIGYQRRDDQAFRTAAAEVIDEERRKSHPVLANELDKILRNGNGHNSSDVKTMVPFQPTPADADRKMALLEIRQPQRFMNELVLSDAVSSTVQNIIRQFRDWDVLEANGLLPTRRVAFCGPSGCGKTAMAEAISAELALPMVYVRFDTVVSSLLGETAANLRKVFDYAHRGRWILFFDEFDAIGRSRDDASEHGELKRVLNAFLQILDNFSGRSLVIAATNFEQVLDPAVWRRFDEIIRFERPTVVQIMQLIRKRLAALVFSDDQVEQISSHLAGASFADAERICLDIRRQCVLRGETRVQEMDLNQALARHDYRVAVLRKAEVAGPPAVDRD
ncbi:MAG: AAA family ATPase [Terriglobales bacterium]